MKPSRYLTPEQLRHLHGGGTAGVGNRNDHIDVVVRPFAFDFLGQPLAHPQARLVDRNIVDDRIGPREIDKLEDAGRVPRHRHALLRVEAALLVDEHRLAGRHVAHHLEARHVECDALRRQHPFDAFLGLAVADHKRTDAVRIAKPENPVADHHGHHGVPAAAAAIHGIGRRENVRRRDARRTDTLHLGGKDVQQNF